MAGDWIPMRMDLADDPAVIQIANTLTMDEFAVVGRLHRLWSWANQQLNSGNATGVSETWIDRYLHSTGFALAMVSAGWLEITAHGVMFPNFDRWNSQGAKQRVLTARRVANHKLKTNAEGNGDSVTFALPTEQNRKEQSQESNHAATPPTAKPRPRKEPDGVHFEFIRIFGDAWFLKYESKYPFDGGKEGAFVKWFRGQLGDDAAKFRKVVQSYFEDSSDFIIGARHSMGMLRSQWVRWATKAPAKTGDRKNLEDFISRGTS